MISAIVTIDMLGKITRFTRGEQAIVNSCYCNCNCSFSPLVKQIAISNIQKYFTKISLKAINRMEIFLRN